MCLLRLCSIVSFLSIFISADIFAQNGHKIMVPDSSIVFSRAVVDSMNAQLCRSYTLIDSLNCLILTKDNEIQKLKEERAFVDTCMARLANRWLFEKFDEQDVNEAIGYFDRILSSQLRSDRSIILKLLKEYKSSYKRFQSILRAAQEDPGKLNPFYVDEYKKRYISKIESMPYYKEYYSASWNIRYLNEQIRIALERLRAHSVNKPVNLSDLIDD